MECLSVCLSVCPCEARCAYQQLSLGLRVRKFINAISGLLLTFSVLYFDLANCTWLPNEIPPDFKG